MGYADFNLLLLVFVRAPCRLSFIFFLSYLFPSFSVFFSFHFSFLT